MASLESGNFFRVIGIEVDGADAQCADHSGGDVIISEVIVEAEVDVCVHGIEAMFLEVIGSDFIGDADAASFLAHVEDECVGELSEMFLSGFELLSAIAAQGVEDVAGEAFGVKARRDVFSLVEIASDESDVVDFCIIIFKGDNLECAELRRQVCACEYFERERRYMTHEISSGEFFEYMTFGHTPECGGSF